MPNQIKNADADVVAKIKAAVRRVGGSGSGIDAKACGGKTPRMLVTTTEVDEFFNTNRLNDADILPTPGIYYKDDNRGLRTIYITPVDSLFNADEYLYTEWVVMNAGSVVDKHKSRSFKRHFVYMTNNPTDSIKARVVTRGFVTRWSEILNVEPTALRVNQGVGDIVKYEWVSDGLLVYLNNNISIPKTTSSVVVFNGLAVEVYKNNKRVYLSNSKRDKVLIPYNRFDNSPVYRIVVKYVMGDVEMLLLDTSIDNKRPLTWNPIDTIARRLYSFTMGVSVSATAVEHNIYYTGTNYQDDSVVRKVYVGDNVINFTDQNAVGRVVDDYLFENYTGIKVYKLSNSPTPTATLVGSSTSETFLNNEYTPVIHDSGIYIIGAGSSRDKIHKVGVGTVATMERLSSGTGAISINNEKILILGGSDTLKMYRDLFIFNTTTNTIHKLRTKLPFPMSKIDVFKSKNSSQLFIYGSATGNNDEVSGGQSYPTVSSNDMLIKFDYLTGNYEILNTPHVQLYGSRMIKHGNNLYVGGGRQADGSLNTVIYGTQV